MLILKTSSEFLRWRASISQKKSIGFVPTMGALHEGHLSLIRQSIRGSDISCVSIFVNPLQFGVDEDLESYPQDINGDIEKLNSIGVEVVFIPNTKDIYGDNDSLLIIENNLSKKLEGKSRPAFFSGVLTIVSKLFNLVRPDFAYFGKKDAQQLIIIKKLVQDMKYPIKIVSCETVREYNGLAMSSRNEYLNKESRESAKIIYLSLLHAKKVISNGEINSSIIKKSMKDMILSENSFSIDYISIADSNSLVEINDKIQTRGEILISLAIFLNGVRLIDNIQIST